MKLIPPDRLPLRRPGRRRRRAVPTGVALSVVALAALAVVIGALVI